LKVADDDIFEKIVEKKLHKTAQVPKIRHNERRDRLNGCVLQKMELRFQSHIAREMFN